MSLLIINLIIFSGLTVGSLNGDHSVTQHMVHSTSQDMKDTPYVIAEVAQLQTTFSLCLYLMKVPLSETLHHLSMSGEMIHWPWVNWVTYTQCSRDIADESGSHLNPSSPNPGQEGIARL